VRGYLLDTGIFLWSMGAEDKLNSEARRVLEETKNQLFLSAATSWEISIKWALGKLELPEPPSTYMPKRITSQAIRALQITHLHAWIAAELPRHHDDPFDRMLIAQAVTEDMVLMTADRQFERYSAQILWCGR